MNAQVQTEKTIPPQRLLRADCPAELLGNDLHLRSVIKLRPLENEDGLQFLRRLRGSTTPEEAVTYTAFAAVPTIAVGWGYECLRLMADHLNPTERPMMEEIAAWLASPTTRMRHHIMMQALWAPVRHPSVFLGLAVGWSTGGPAPNDPERPPMHKAPLAINSAVLSCLARSQLSQRSIYLARFIDMAEAFFRAY